MPRAGMSPQNFRAIEIWKRLDGFGRGLDGFSGAPLPLRIEAVNEECGRSEDREAMIWRVLLVEEKIYGLRVERFKAKQDEKKS